MAFGRLSLDHITTWLSTPRSSGAFMDKNNPISRNSDFEIKTIEKYSISITEIGNCGGCFQFGHVTSEGVSPPLSAPTQEKLQRDAQAWQISWQCRVTRTTGPPRSFQRPRNTLVAAQPAHFFLIFQVSLSAPMLLPGHGFQWPLETIKIRWRERRDCYDVVY